MFRDVRYAVRSLGRMPGFALVAILTLGLGIGANTAIFSVVNGVLLAPLPYPDDDRLVRIYGTDREYTDLGNVSPMDFLDWQERAESLEALGGFATLRQTLLEGDEPQEIEGIQVTPGFFRALGVAPALGRPFDAADGTPGAEGRILLGHAFWRSALGGDPAVVGRTLAFDEGAREVIGVMPPGFAPPGSDPEEVAIYGNLVLDPARHGRGGHWLRAVARLAPGTSVTAANEELDAIMTGLAAEYPDTNLDERARMIPLRESLIGEVRPLLLLLLGAVGIVLLIACSNVANLLLARAVSRESEIGVRLALGAGRLRLVGQLLTESFVLAAAGGALGLVLGTWGLELIVASIPEGVPRVSEISLEPRVLGFALLATVLTGVLFGSVPAWRASRPDVHTALRDGRAAMGGEHRRARSLLVIGQVAMALILMVGAVLFLRSFRELTSVDPGFRADSTLTLRVSVPRTRYPDAASRDAFYRNAVERIGALPGVTAVGGVNTRPLSAQWSCDGFSLEDRGPFPAGEQPCVESRVATAGYFEAMGIPLVDGRGFAATDAPDAPAVVLVNRALADTYWPGQSAVGKRMKWGSWDSEDPWRTIIGIVGDVHHFGLGQDQAPEVYMLHRQYPFPATMTLAVRSGLPPERLLGPVSERIRSLDPRLAVTQVATLRQIVSGSVARERFQTWLLGAFAMLALVLAVGGVFGVISYTVSRRVREIGVRIALGARGRDIYALVLRDGALLGGTGIVLGIAGALALTRSIDALLFAVRPTDAFAFAAAPLLLAGAVLLACWWPARRAVRVDPLDALRCD